MAGEPESLHIHEPLKARIERHNYDRLLMLSDGVFAIAITLLALELKLPDHWDGSVGALFGATGRPLVGYLFGFGLVGSLLVHPPSAVRRTGAGRRGDHASQPGSARSGWADTLRRADDRRGRADAGPSLLPHYGGRRVRIDRAHAGAGPVPPEAFPCRC